MEKDIREVVSKNIILLRTNAGLTQAEFAAAMSYSDKAISKWERNESIPDITVLVRIAGYFGVTVDWLVTEHDGQEIADGVREEDDKKRLHKTHVLITIMSVCLVWVVAILGFSFGLPFAVNFPLWLLFVFAIPVSSIVSLVLSCIWFDRKLKFVLISVLMWSAVVSIYLALILGPKLNFWPLFIACVPGQAIIVLWSHIKTKRGRKNG